MDEFLITTDMAKKREIELIASGEIFGLTSSFVDINNYFPGGVSDLERYINDCQVRFFSISEVIKPNHPDKALEVGFTELVAPLHLWPWVALVLRVGDLMREAVGRAVVVRNVYRPMSYNKLVAASGIDSDHPNACSGDFDFKSVNDRRIAESVVRGLHRDHPQLEISLGMGNKTLHVGVMSPKGSRSWFYNSYSDERIAL